MASDLALTLWPAVYIHICTHIWIGARLLIARIRHRCLVRQIQVHAATVPPEDLAEMLASFVAWKASQPTPTRQESKGEDRDG